MVPVAEVPVPELFVPELLELPLLVWPVELVPELVPLLLPLPQELVPLVAPPPVAELPFADIGEVLSAALLVLPVPVELQAARLKAIRVPIITLW